jgi:hypothetical protein
MTIMLLDLVWMRMYLSQSIYIEVDWSVIELNSISFHFNTCRLGWIPMHPNTALDDKYMHGGIYVGSMNICTVVRSS